MLCVITFSLLLTLCIKLNIFIFSQLLFDTFCTENVELIKTKTPKSFNVRQRTLKHIPPRYLKWQVHLWAFHPSSMSSSSFPHQTKLLTQYVLNLAKYDQNYDIRDRARFIRQLIVPTEKSGALSKYAKKLFLALKPAPVLESPFKGTDDKTVITASGNLLYDILCSAF